MRRRRSFRIRFNLGLNTIIESNEQRQMDRLSLPESWWSNYYLRRRSDDSTLASRNIISRSAKHDYRNPDSNYSDGIVDALRRRSQLEDTEELDLQQRANPFLSTDFLKTLQRFGLFPAPEDEDDDQTTAGADEDQDEDETVQLRKRTLSGSSNNLRSRATSYMGQTDEEPDDPKTLENSMEGIDQAGGSNPPHTLPHVPVNLPYRKRLQLQIRRWTITSMSSLLSLPRWRTVKQPPFISIKRSSFLKRTVH